MDSKFATISEYENVDIYDHTYDEEKFLNVLRSIMSVDVPVNDQTKGLHPTNNFGLEEWALYHVLTDTCHGKMGGRSIEQAYERYHGMGIVELEGKGW